MTGDTTTPRVPLSPFDDSHTPTTNDPSGLASSKPEGEFQDGATTAFNRFAGNPGAAKARLRASVKTIIQMNRSTSRFAQAFTVSLSTRFSGHLLVFPLRKLTQDTLRCSVDYASSHT